MRRLLPLSWRRSRPFARATQLAEHNKISRSLRSFVRTKQLVKHNIISKGFSSFVGTKQLVNHNIISKGFSSFVGIVQLVEHNKISKHFSSFVGTKQLVNHNIISKLCRSFVKIARFRPVPAIAPPLGQVAFAPRSAQNKGQGQVPVGTAASGLIYLRNKLGTSAMRTNDVTVICASSSCTRSAKRRTRLCKLSSS